MEIMATRKGFSRSDRIAEQIQRELAELVRTGLKDPRVWLDHHYRRTGDA
jgi:ribosome-binding factor A